MTIKEYMKRAHLNAVEHGFWDKPPTVPASLSLIHEEVSEVLQEFRNGKEPTETYYSGKKKFELEPNTPDVANMVVTATSGTKGLAIPYGDSYIITDKPEGTPSEMADIAIRVFDFCAHHGIDLEAAIDEKMAYNETRPYKHGNKKL